MRLPPPQDPMHRTRRAARVVLTGARPCSCPTHARNRPSCAHAEAVCNLQGVSTRAPGRRSLRTSRNPTNQWAHSLCNSGGRPSNASMARACSQSSHAPAASAMCCVLSWTTHGVAFSVRCLRGQHTRSLAEQCHALLMLCLPCVLSPVPGHQQASITYPAWHACLLEHPSTRSLLAQLATPATACV